VGIVWYPESTTLRGRCPVAEEEDTITVHADGANVVVASEPPDTEAPAGAASSTNKSSTEDRGLWGRFFGRLATVLLRPHGFWTKLQSTKPHPEVGELLWPHLTLLALVGAGTVLLGHIFGGMDVGHAVVRGGVQFVSAFLLVVVVAVVARLVVIRGKDPTGPKDHTFRRAFTLSAYGCVPLLLAPVIALIPSQFATTVAGVLLMPYTFWALAGGLHTWLGVKERRGANATAILCSTVFVAWALLELLRQLAVNAAVVSTTAMSDIVVPTP
jgi:hypothetical protein